MAAPDGTQYMEVDMENAGELFRRLGSRAEGDDIGSSNAGSLDEAELVWAAVERLPSVRQRHFAVGLVTSIGVLKSNKHTLTILDNVSGILKPGRNFERSNKARKGEKHPSESRNRCIYEGCESLLFLNSLKVTSRKDQEQYWSDPSKPYVFIPSSKIAEIFKNSEYGKSVQSSLSASKDGKGFLPSSLARTNYAISKGNLQKACFSRELLLIGRHRFLYVFRTCQVCSPPPPPHHHHLLLLLLLLSF
ncbi:hypothetical protein Cni_G24455 [Canna indica]|uniref:Uncharacterized protein n=1 Tax=Canna indica TaxID=4628 RepID=A0AAQ3QLH3_9LILI|nr:hypothetical protein Cni_G24455 [Canna indica]